ncbi:hypothetical protein [Flagellimonas onchidii]|uniref:hypothetical protein n=1 Tax=Flagellimonas onchidii TaxID=2562684 RepID=UPI0010A5E34D|nr:hypothetical protein [Allomuricauda onchidii]
MNHVLKLRITYGQLAALNQVWGYLDFLDETEPENRAIISMARKLAEKLVKKQVSMQFGEQKKDKRHTLSFEYYQAYFFEMLLRRSLNVFPEGYGQTVIHNIANELHRQLR